MLGAQSAPGQHQQVQVVSHRSAHETVAICVVPSADQDQISSQLRCKQEPTHTFDKDSVDACFYMDSVDACTYIKT